MIDWSVSEAVPSESGDGAAGFRPGESRDHDIELARGFISQLPSESDHVVPQLSREEWLSVWTASQGAESEEELIAQMVLLAYRQRRRGLAPPPVGGPAQATPDPIEPSHEVSWTTDPGPRSAWLVDPDPLKSSGAPARSDDLPDPPTTATSVFTLAELPDPPLSLPDLPSAPPDPMPLIPFDFAAPEEYGEPFATAMDPVLPPPPARVRTRRSFRPAPQLRARGAHSKSRRMDDRSRARWLTLSSWARNIGVLLILFAAWQLWGTSITQHHSQSVLASQFSAKVKQAGSQPPSAPKSALIPASAQLPVPAEGTVMAQLQIPKINLTEYVVSGTNASDLAKGPGHYVGTAMPGQAGNVAIAGHRTTHGAPFNRLAELAIGDPIYLTTLSGQKMTYIVSATPVPVSPSDVTVLNNFGDNRITLTTCNPEYSAAQRLIVVAAYKPPGASQPEAIVKGGGSPYRLAAVSMGWNWPLLPLVFVECGALVLLGLGFRRLTDYFGRGLRWLILVPIWLALVLALFEALTEFLPAAV
jgi:LPXTG-site transpeptidase (sortase) family protein